MKPRFRPVYLAAALGYGFLHLPVLVLVAFSFNSSRFSVEWTGFTFQWYRALGERGDLLQGLKVSLIVGGLATLLATILGTLLALGLRGRLPGRRLIEGFLYVPVVTPEIITGVSLLLLFAAGGIPLGMGTIVVAHVAFNIGFVAIVVRARLEGMDRSLEEAARVLGAGPVTVLRTVTIPQLGPGIVAGALLAFTMSFDDYIITSLVSGPGSSTLPVVVYSMVRRNIEPTVNAISTVIMLVTALGIWIMFRFTRERPLVAGRG